MIDTRANEQGRISMNRLEGKVAVITGAASGIGLAIARRFASEGAFIVAGDVDDDGLDRLAHELGHEGCCAVRCDVTSEIDVENLTSLAVSHFGRLDVAVANAGAGGYSLLADHPLDEWRRVTDLCLTGVFLTLKHAGTRMADGGSLITIASLNAVQPARGMAAYCAAKAGAVMLAKVAAMEFGERGIRSNAIGPGLVQTNATLAFFSLPDIVTEFEDNAPLGRHAQPEEVAGLAVYLASDESSFVSASFVSIDGGGSTGRYPNLPRILDRYGG